MNRRVSGSILSVCARRFDHVRVGHIRAADLIQDHIEELETRLCRDEAVSPASHERCVMELVLGTDKPGHWQAFPIDLSPGVDLRNAYAAFPAVTIQADAPSNTEPSFSTGASALRIESATAFNTFGS